MPYRRLSGLIILLILLVGYLPLFHRAVTDNIDGLSRLRNLPQGANISSSDCQPEEIGYYPALAACLNYSVQNDAHLGHLLVNNWGYHEHPERRNLLLIFNSRLFRSEGNYLASCEMLKEAGDVQEMMILAQAAFSTEDWVALESYLNCIGGPAEGALGLSFTQTSVLFHNLGKHFENMKELEKALWAYQNAINWYPTVWADPVLAAAAILENTGQRLDAEALVSQNFERAELPWSIFNLGMQWGKYLDEDGDEVKAYCVYQTSRKAGEESPPNMAPAGRRTELASRITSLESKYRLTPEICKTNE